MADLIAYVKPRELEDGTVTSIGYLRGTPRYVAGSRFRYIPDCILFNYDNLVKAIGDAIDKEAAEHNNEFVTQEDNNAYQEREKIPFDELMKKFETLIDTIRGKVTKAEFVSKYQPRIIAITDKYLGTGKKVSNCTEKQYEQLLLIVEELEELAKE